MEITNVESIVLRSSVGKISMPGGYSEFDATVRPIVARIQTDEGITGIGETYLDDPNGDMALAMGHTIDALGDELIGEDPRDVTRHWQNLYLHTKRSEAYRALSALDEALWDITGKSVGEPIYQLLGGTVSNPNAYATFAFAKEADELVSDALWFAERGFTTMKIVAGFDVETDRDRIRTVASNLPDGFGLAIDANTTYDVPDALQVAQTASEHELEWFEEPIDHNDIDGMARLNARTSVPISAYQNHYTHTPAVKHLQANALEIYQPSINRVGGITAASRVATLVESFNKRLVPHAFGPGINYAASLHIAAASPACDLIEFAVYDQTIDDPGEFIASPYVANTEDISVGPDGTVSPPDKPGLGIELDEDTLEEYRVD